MKRTPLIALVVVVVAACAAAPEPFDLHDGERSRLLGERDADDEEKGESAGEGEGEGEGVAGGEGEGEGEGVAGGEGEGEGVVPDSCDAGFVVDGTRCIPAGPVALTRRSEGEVCSRWNETGCDP